MACVAVPTLPHTHADDAAQIVCNVGPGCSSISGHQTDRNLLNILALVVVCFGALVNLKMEVEINKDRRRRWEEMRPTPQ